MTSPLASLRNPRISLARKLARRRVRDQERAFVVEGPLAIRAAIDGGAQVFDVFATEEALGDAPPGTEPVLVTDQVMQAITDTRTPQGVAAIVGMNDVSLDPLPPGDLFLVLAEVRDPGNAGTLMRSAVAAGATAVIFSRGSVDPYSPKTVRASAGTIFGTHVVRDAEPSDVLEALARAGCGAYGAEAHEGLALWEADLTRPSAIVVGNEAWGLADGPWSSVERLSIPMPGPVESLNAAVAGSVILFECVRQRRGSSS